MESPSHTLRKQVCIFDSTQSQLSIYLLIYFSYANNPLHQQYLEFVTIQLGDSVSIKCFTVPCIALVHRLILTSAVGKCWKEFVLEQVFLRD